VNPVRQTAEFQKALLLRASWRSCCGEGRPSGAQKETSQLVCGFRMPLGEGGLALLEDFT